MRRAYRSQTFFPFFLISLMLFVPYNKMNAWQQRVFSQWVQQLTITEGRLSPYYNEQWSTRKINLTSLVHAWKRAIIWIPCCSLSISFSRDMHFLRWKIPAKTFSVLHFFQFAFHSQQREKKMHVDAMRIQRPKTGFSLFILYFRLGWKIGTAGYTVKWAMEFKNNNNQKYTKSFASIRLRAIYL